MTTGNGGFQAGKWGIISASFNGLGRWWRERRTVVC